MFNNLTHDSKPTLNTSDIFSKSQTNLDSMPTS